ncbi:MAG: NUDIX hydrolase [Brachybacterium sp.]|uniref:NUDIX domain-containing protein n=1 Tax=Brachybacterium sp. TaxID=1891286 RepID=UPI00264A1552|nr:NUDIX hydrolase [Brachybacterium sp.]MDN5685797.1 NUDIX hydrolase [Brachybacterium sp.]
MPRLLPDPAYFATLPKVISSGSVILRDEHEHFVVEKPNYRDHWLLPGGGVDPGEDPRQCAQREVAEELGLDLEIGRLLAIDWMPSSAVRSAPMGVHFVFDAGVVPRAELEAHIVPQAEELDDWALIDEADADVLSAWGGARARRALAVLRGEAELDLAAHGHRPPSPPLQARP